MIRTVWDIKEVVAPVVAPTLGSHMCTALSPPPHHATRPPPATHAIPMIAFGTSYDCVFCRVSTSHDFNT